ncbi:MAG TPA: NAD-dependent epimerase/dehydratase family protein [Acidimicrobiales bacterium]
MTETPIEPYPPRRVLVTGGLGFIGSHLVDRLLGDGDEVTVLDNLLIGDIRNVAPHQSDPRLRVVVGDARDADVLAPLVAGADVVVHLAAALGVELVVEHPLMCLETNLLATHAVLEAAAAHRVPTMVASSSEVYGKSTTLPFGEGDDLVLGPTTCNRWSYAAAKLVDELLALAFSTERGLPVVVLRFFNTVGPRQTGRYGMVVPRFVEAALRGQPLPVHGDGEQSRCFLHVRDAVDAVVRLSRTPDAYGAVFNIGSEESVTINELAERVLDRAERQELLPVAAGPRIHHVPYADVFGPRFEDVRARRPDTTKLRALTGWHRRRTLDDVIDDVLAERAKRLALR